LPLLKGSLPPSGCSILWRMSASWDQKTPLTFLQPCRLSLGDFYCISMNLTNGMNISLCLLHNSPSSTLSSCNFLTWSASPNMA
jgi:hypothetical protein